LGHWTLSYTVVNDSFSAQSAAALGPRSGRAEAANLARELGLPSEEAEEWRYSPVADLPLGQMAPILASPDGPSTPALNSPVELAGEPAATVNVVDGFVVSVAVDPGWQAKGLRVEFDESRSLGVIDGETAFDHLHRAFSPGALVIDVPQGLAVTAPIVIESYHHTADGLSCPHLVVRAGAAAEVAVVERQTSTESVSMSIPVVELDAADSANLRYQVIQEHSRSHWQVGRQRSTVGGQATLSSGAAAFGGAYGRTRTDSRLLGRGATANLVAAVYGDGDQILDFRTFQHHQARDTRSDLLFKGSQDDRSGSIYTGLIHIHPDGAGSNAFQTNRNVKLSDDAWAWSVPNLEIENNEVHCSHASTVSPVDADQRFYLHSRGVPPAVADRLIVAGFYHEVIERLPVPEARGEVTRLIAEKLDHRKQPVSSPEGGQS
jgi:Fe-S cluster assembly protein SufD